MTNLTSQITRLFVNNWWMSTIEWNEHPKQAITQISLLSTLPAKAKSIARLTKMQSTMIPDWEY